MEVETSKTGVLSHSFGAEPKMHLITFFLRKLTQEDNQEILALTLKE